MSQRWIHKNWKHFDGDKISNNWFEYEEQTWSWTPTILIAIGFVVLAAIVIIGS